MNKNEFCHDENAIVLQKLIEDGTLDLATVEYTKFMTKKTQVNKVHTQKINFRSDGRCYTYVYIKGERKQKNFDTEKELYLFLYDFYFGRKKISLEKLFPEFMLYRRNRGKVSSKTLEENKNFWNRFLKDTNMVKKPICDLTVKLYIDFFEELTKNGEYTAKCIGNLKSLLNKMYDYAIREEIVEYNPLKNIDFKEFNYFVPFNDDKVYRNEDRLKLLHHLQNVDDPYALAIRLMFQLTIRIGELKSFRWSDVDFYDRTISISKQALNNRSMNDDLSFSSRETVVVNQTKKIHLKGNENYVLQVKQLKFLKRQRKLILMENIFLCLEEN